MFIIFNKLRIQVNSYLGLIPRNPECEISCEYFPTTVISILGLNITHGYVMANIITSKSGNIKEDLRHHAEVLETAMSSKISSPWLEAYKSEKM